jgi:hypothetical protein
VTEVLFIVDQLLDVLAAAHEKSVVHRDIKPENLFITRAGVLKVLDFGIAKVFERQQTRTTSTRAGMIMGTPAFMAPEQARGRWEDVDGRTDLWAVGATMFTLLTGRHVHEADSSQEQLIASATTAAPPIASVAPEVPQLAAAIVDRALAFDRATRWADAAEMQKVVREAIEASGSYAPPSGVATLAAAASPMARTTLRSDAGILSGPSGVSAVPTWSRDRDARAADTVRLRGVVQELQGKYAAAKKRAAEAHVVVEAAQAERTSLAEWFHRRAGKRTAAVDEARADVRRNLVAIARRAAGDDAAFGADFDAGRAKLATLERAAESAARDVTVHEAALVAHDPRALRTGVLTGALAALVVLALLVAPIVWRATRVIEPPIPHTIAPAPAPAKP